MILVSEAGWRGLSALVACITAPELASTTMEAIGRLVAFGGGRVVMAVASCAGVGAGGDGGNGQQRRQTEGAPTEWALDKGSRTQHPLSPTPLFRSA